MGDMAETVIPKSDQMNAEDLDPPLGPRTFTISRVVVNPSAEQPVSVWFHEFSPRRPFKPGLTVRRLMMGAWGDESSAYVGQRMTLYTDPDIMFGGVPVGGIRVSHMSGLKRQYRKALPISKGRRVVYVVDPLPDAPPPSPAAALAAALAAAGHRTPAEMLAYCRTVVDRPIKGAQDLTPAEIATVHEALVASRSSAPPAGSVEAAAATPGEFVPTSTQGVYGYNSPGEPSDAELEAAFEAEQARLAAEGADGG